MVSTCKDRIVKVEKISSSGLSPLTSSSFEAVNVVSNPSLSINSPKDAASPSTPDTGHHSGTPVTATIGHKVKLGYTLRLVPGRVAVGTPSAPPVLNTAIETKNGVVNLSRS